MSDIPTSEESDKDLLTPDDIAKTIEFLGGDPYRRNTFQKAANVLNTMPGALTTLKNLENSYQNEQEDKREAKRKTQEFLIESLGKDLYNKLYGDQPQFPDIEPTK